MPGDDHGIVGVVDSPKLDGRVVMEITVGVLITEAEGRYRFAGIEGLFGVVDDPRLHEFDDPVADQFRVDPEMPLVLEIGQDGVGDAAVAHLDGVPVLHEAGDVLADPHDDLRVDPFGVFQEELVIRDDIIDVPDMDEGVAVDPGDEMV